MTGPQSPIVRVAKRAIEVILRPKSFLTLLDNDTNFGVRSVETSVPHNNLPERVGPLGRAWRAT